MLTKTIAPALLSLFALCLNCAAQTTVVDVKDDSTVNCPVRMSGTITFTESEAGGFHHAALSSYALAATNLSNVPIVALVTSTLIGTSRGPLIIDDRQLDAFFSHDLEIAPGKTWTQTQKDTGTFSTEVKDGASKVAPSASSKVIFVQFADSSTCGDVTDGRVVDLMEARVDLLQALKKWDDAAKLGDSQFLKALAEEPTDRTGNASGILNDIREKQKEIGSAAVIDHIRSMLDVAASR